MARHNLVLLLIGAAAGVKRYVPITLNYRYVFFNRESRLVRPKLPT